jgi:hypothetical protein
MLVGFYHLKTQIVYLINGLFEHLDVIVGFQQHAAHGVQWW